MKKETKQSVYDSGNDFRFLYFVVSISQRARKPNAKRKLAFGFAEVQPFFETQSQTALSTPFPFVDSAKLAHII